MNYRTTSNVVNYTVLDVKQDIHFYDEPEVEGWPPTISRDLKEYLQPTFKSKPYLQVNQTISWRGKDYPKTYLVIIVHSSAHNGFERRQIIRQTWAKDEKYLPTQIMFLLGKNAEFQHLIEEEIEAYNDILQADFQDTYANLTLKSMFMLKYGELLPENVVKYVMKVDDDSYINLKRLVSYSEMIEKRCNQNCILGHVLGPDSPVIRSKDHDRKFTVGWEVPWYIYNSTTFPNAVSGSGYLISRKSIPCLYKAGLDTSFLNLEDVFITGLAASACHIKLINSRWFNFIGKNSRRVKNHDILVHNVRNSSEMAFIFKKLH